jgi:hypothetical protein
MKFVLLLFALPLMAIDPEENQFLALINAYRAQHGAPALTISESLQHSARWFSYDLARTGSTSHIDSLGRSPSARNMAFGYPSVVTGENIHGGSRTAQDAFNAFRDACDPNSAGVCTYAHRLNMLHSFWTVIGIGRAYVPGTTYAYYWTTDFGSQTSNGTVPPVVVPPITPPPAPPPVVPPVPPPPPVIPPDPSVCFAPPGMDIYWHNFEAGDWLIKIESPYGLRVYLDGFILLERWREMPPYTYNLRRTLTGGFHCIIVEHYEMVKPQKITVTWTRL